MPNSNQSSSFELADGFDPFSDDAQPVQTPTNATQVATPDPVPDPIVPQGTPDPVPDPTAQNFNPDQYLKEKFGFDSYEQAEQEFKRVKEFKEPEFNFKDDTSKTLFNAIKEGKTEEVYDILNQQKKLEKLITGEINANLAVDIIKTNIANKYKDLNADEVDLLFYESYYTPAKPEQGYDETDEDYSQKVKTWESQVEYAQKKMIIDAKVYRPELAKLKSELVLPDIYKEAEMAAKHEADSKEEAQFIQQSRSIYEKTLNSDFNSFSGFNVSVKDEEVDIPISFNVGEDERLSIKNDLNDFDSDSYFEGRWFTEDGTPKIQQIMADKYLLENRDKILQKVANEAASQRLLAHLKKSGNVNLNPTTPQGTATQNPNAQMDSLADWAFGN